MPSILVAGRGAKAWLLLAATAMPVFIVRLALLAEQHISFSAADARGLLSDLLVSIVISGFVFWCSGRSRSGAVVFLLLWVLVNYGNYEHITTLGASASLAQIGYLFDPTFLLGSALEVSSPLLLTGMAAASVILASLGLRQPDELPSFSLLAVFCVPGLLFLSQIPVSVEVLDWRQTHVVLKNAAILFNTDEANLASNIVTKSGDSSNDFYVQDLQGEPIIAMNQRTENVLLVMLEGISGVHLPSLAEVHGIDNLVKLSQLDTIAASNLSFSTFISHNRQTNRGEYAILCGDMPYLRDGEPKMTQALSKGDITCLPDVLSEAGYNTAYLQAAPLGFMSKDSFMPMAGFAEVYGARWFPENYASNQWGIDDRAFLMQSLKKIEQLQRRGSSWFLTLLTVGTHHPYIVPADFGEKNFPQAARYLDASIAEFIKAITEMGVLEDTLVILTSDESVGITGYRGSGKFNKDQSHDGVTKKIADNWGFLVALLPEKKQARIDQPFAQIDVSLSILDYLGLADKGQEFIGRSIFRHYESVRPIAFGNVYKNYIGLFDGAEILYLCPPDKSTQCEQFLLPGQALFSPLRESLDDTSNVSLLQRLMTKAEDRLAEDRKIHLVKDEQISLFDTQGMQVIFGGQYLSTAAHSKITVEIDMTLVGDQGAARFGLLLQSKSGKHFSRSIPALNTGDRLLLEIEYYSAEPLDTLAAIGTVMSGGEVEMQLKFTKALLSIADVAVAKREAEDRLSIRKAKIVRAE